MLENAELMTESPRLVVDMDLIMDLEAAGLAEAVHAVNRKELDGSDSGNW